MIKAVYQFLVVFFQVIFPAKRAVRIGGLVIRLLYATAGRSIVASNGQAYHRAVRQVDRALHQSFAESAPTYDYTSVPILNGSGYDSLADAEYSSTKTTRRPSLNFPFPLAWKLLRRAALPSV